MSLLLQFAAFGALAAYFAWWCAGMRRRNRQSWAALTAQIHFESSSDFPTVVHDASHRNRSLWPIFQNARIVLEMADYAKRNMAPGNAEVDPKLLNSIRKEAMQVRLSAVTAMAKATVSTRTSVEPKTHA